MRLNIQDILRAQDIQRWTVVRTARPQSLAEHTFNVMMIVRAICKKLGIPDERMIKLAIEHDLDEIKTGDIATPAKYYMKDHGIDINSLFWGGNHTPGEIEYRIIKAADTLETFWFITENGVGRHAEEVRKNLEARLHKIIDGLGQDTTEAITEVANEIFDGGFIYE